MDLKRAAVRRYRKSIATISILMTALMVFFSAVPVEVQAAGSEQYANTVTLEAILNDRSFVVDTLTVKSRKEQNYGGKGFTNNPHFKGVYDHFLYEDLLNQYEDDLKLKALVNIYNVKSNLENYPLETLAEAGRRSSPFFSFLHEINHTASTSPYFDMNKALADAYTLMGGTFPVEEVLKKVNTKIADDENWKDYDKSALQSMLRKEGSEEYADFKETLDDSSDSRDEDVLSWLNSEESKSFSIGGPIMQEFRKIVENMRGATVAIADGETTRKAKIYDVILNNIFSSEYTSGTGVTVGRESEAKADMDESTQVLKNEEQYISHAQELWDALQLDAEKVFVDDYVELLKNADENKLQNIMAAYGQLTGPEGWYPAAAASIISKETAARYQMNPDVELRTIKNECDEKYFIHSQTASFLSTAKSTIGYVTDTLENYYLLDTLVRENEYIRGILERSIAQGAGNEDAGWKATVEKYRKLLDMSDADVDNQIFLSILQTASQKAEGTVEKEAGKLMRSAASRAIISTGKDAVARAKIAKSVSSVSVVYTAVDILDDYIAGMQDAAEKVFEIKYLLDVQQYITEAYEADVAAYQAATDPFEKDELAGKALEDLQFLKQIKLLQIDDAYQTFYAMQNKTLSGKIVQFIDEYGGVTTMEEDYHKQMDAVTQMMVCPIGGTPFTIKSGTTMTIGKEMYDGVHYSYYGTLRNANGEIKGKIAEMDLLAAGGLNVEGKLVIDDDIYLPILMGSGEVEVAAGGDPFIGHINGNLKALSDMHINGSVNGTVTPVTENITVEIDGNVDVDQYASNSGLNLAEAENRRPSVLVHGDFTADVRLELSGLNMTVEGETSISTSEESADSATYMKLTGADLEAKDKFTYGGIGETAPAYIDFRDRLINYQFAHLRENSHLVIWDMAYFPMRNAYFNNDSDSAVVMKGDGTAGLVAYTYEDDVPGYTTLQFGLSRLVRHKPSTDIHSQHGGKVSWIGHAGQGLEFETDRIKTLDNVRITDFTFSDDLHVTDTCRPAVLGGDAVTNVIFDRDLEVTDRSEVGVNGLIVNGDIHVNNGGRLGIDKSNQGKRAFLCRGNLYIGSENETARSELYSGEHVWNPDTWSDDTSMDPESISKVEGDMVVQSGLLHPNCFEVGGDATIEANVELDPGLLIVDGVLTTKRQMSDVILRGGANFRLDPETIDEDHPYVDGYYGHIYLEQGEKECQEIRITEPYRISYLHVKDAVCSFPEGLDADIISVEDGNTLTIRGETPFLRGEAACGPGNIVIEDDMHEFSFNDRTGGHINNFHNIWAKKDLTVKRSMITARNYRDEYLDGTLRVDGTLTAADGAGIVLGNDAEIGQLVNQGSGSISIEGVDVLKLGGLHAEGPGMMNFSDVEEFDWGGGDIEAENTRVNFGKTVLNSDRIPHISAEGGEISFDTLYVNSPGFEVNGEVDIEDLRSSRESFTVNGDLPQFRGNINAARNRMLKRIEYRDVTGLERGRGGNFEIQGRIASSNSEDCWDVKRIDPQEDGIRFDADHILQGISRSQAYTVRYRCNDFYDLKTEYYKPDSLIFPCMVSVTDQETGETSEHIVDPFYEDKEQTIPVSVESLKERKLTGDLDLYYNYNDEYDYDPDEFDDDPAEYPWSLSCTEDYIETYYDDDEELNLEAPVKWSAEWRKNKYPLNYRWYRTDIVGNTTELTEYEDYQWLVVEPPIQDLREIRCDVSDPTDPDHTESYTFTVGEIVESGKYLWGIDPEPNVIIEGTPENLETYTFDISEDSRIFTVKVTGIGGLFTDDCVSIGASSSVPIETKVMEKLRHGYSRRDLAYDWNDGTTDEINADPHKAMCGFGVPARTTYYYQVRVKDYDGSQNGGSITLRINNGSLYTGEMEYLRKGGEARLIRGLDTYKTNEEDEQETVILPGEMDGDIIRFTKLNGDIEEYVYHAYDANWDETGWIGQGEDHFEYNGYLSFPRPETNEPYITGRVYMQSVTYHYDNMSEDYETEAPFRLVDDIGTQADQLNGKAGNLQASDAQAVSDFAYTVMRYSKLDPQDRAEYYGISEESFNSYKSICDDLYTEMSGIMGADWDAYGQYDPDTSDVPDTPDYPGDEPDVPAKPDKPADSSAVPGTTDKAKTADASAVPGTTDKAKTADATKTAAGTTDKAKAADAAKTAAGTTQKVKGNTYKVIKNTSGKAAGTIAFTKAKNVKSVTVPATVKINGKTFKVTQINANAFKGRKIRTVTVSKNVKTIKKNAFKGSKATKLIIKSKRLTKKSVKGALRGSKVRTVQVKIGKKSVNKKYVKKYKKIFTKRNAGRKVTVK